MFGRRAAFWVAVGAVGVLSNFALELAADRLPLKGLQRFTAYVHRGHGSSESA